MIAWLEGKIVEKHVSRLVIGTNGVGYLVETSMNTFFRLPDEGEQVSLYIHTIVREDAYLLYGFLEKAEREMFQLLIKVNGIGPKLAIGILSSVNAADLVQAVKEKNAVALSKIPGIGKKTAERLVVEMQDKLNDLSYVNAPAEISAAPNVKKLPLGYSEAAQDAMSALTALGYNSPQILHIMEKVGVEDKTSEQLIREALQYFSKV